MAENNNKKVLLVEDAEDLRTLYGYFIRHLGFNFYQASSGDEALKALATGPTPDLILLDYSLSDMTGKDFLDQAEEKSLLDLKQSRVIFISGYGKTLSDHRVAEAAQKPSGVGEIEVLLRRHLVH